MINGLSSTLVMHRNARMHADSHSADVLLRDALHLYAIKHALSNVCKHVLHQVAASLCL